MAGTKIGTSVPATEIGDVCGGLGGLESGNMHPLSPPLLATLGVLSIPLPYTQLYLETFLLDVPVQCF